MDLHESISVIRQDNDDLRQENVRLRNELNQAMQVLAILKYKGISSIDVSLDDLRRVSENPPTVDIRHQTFRLRGNVVEW